MIVIMSAELFEPLLRLSDRDQVLAAGELLFHSMARVDSLFLVLEGELRLVRILPDGAPLTLQRARPGEVLAEASIFSERYHCDGQAILASRVRVIDMKTVREALHSDRTFGPALLRHLACHVQETRARAELLSLRSVRAKVDAWIVLNGNLPPKGQGRHLASEIGVTPEALYRELARRRSA